MELDRTTDNMRDSYVYCGSPKDLLCTHRKGVRCTLLAISCNFKSDTHIDICYPKKAPIEATKLTLIDEKNHKINLIQNAELQYHLID